MSWISAFKAIPWGELLAAAPVVVKGTRRLWETVRHQRAGAPSGPDAASRLQSLEAQILELRGELTAASQLLATLAEHNAQLVEALEIMRKRSRALLVITGLLAVGVVGLIVHAA